MTAFLSPCLKKKSKQNRTEQNRTEQNRTEQKKKKKIETITKPNKK
jgi:hypothetical protein